jgi:hypothetical protein
MLADLYTILKYKIQYPAFIPVNPNLGSVKYINVDWYLGQDLNIGDHVLSTPIAYIEFLPVDFTTLPNGIQHGNIEFNVHLITETAYGDERDMINDTIGHQAFETGIFKALHNERTQGEVIPGMDVVFHETITRIGLVPHTRINKLVKSIQRFRCVAYDFEACPQMVSVLATLDLNAFLVKTLNPPDLNIVIEIPAQG